MERWKRRLLLVILVAALAMLPLIFVASASKIFVSTGLVVAIAAILQAEISGVFVGLWEVYGDEEKFPHGPPSHFVRETIDNPDTPLRNRIRGYVFFNKRTAIHLVLFSILLQLIGTWL